MSDLVGNPEDRFAHNEAHILSEAHLAYPVAAELSELGVNRGRVIHFLIRCQGLRA